MATTSTMPVVSSGLMTGYRKRCASSSGDGDDAGLFSSLRGSYSRAGDRRLSADDARPRYSSARPTVTRCTVSILRSMAT